MAQAWQPPPPRWSWSCVSVRISVCPQVFMSVCLPAPPCGKGKVSIYDGNVCMCVCVYLAALPPVGGMSLSMTVCVYVWGGLVALTCSPRPPVGWGVVVGCMYT